MVVPQSHPRVEQRPKPVFGNVIIQKSQASLLPDYSNTVSVGWELLCSDGLKPVSITVTKNWDYSERLRSSRTFLWI